MEKVRARVYVSGLVQGVFYRANTVEAAGRIGGLSGWVRNLRDGMVEVLAEGDRGKVEELISWLNVGPPASRVTGVEVEWEDHTGEYSTFGVRY